MIIGLTGGIGTGKSFIANILHSNGYAHFDCDKVVHQWYDGPGIDEIKKILPEAIVDGKVNKLIVRDHLTDDTFLSILEVLTTKWVIDNLNKAINKERYTGRDIILDVPLLFEFGFNQYCDKVIVVTCPKFLQLQRVAKRDNRSIRELKLLMTRQMSTYDKERKADIVIHSGLGKARTYKELKMSSLIP